MRLVNREEINKYTAARNEWYQTFLHYLQQDESSENIDVNWRRWACALNTNEVYYELAEKCVEYDLPCPDPDFSIQANYGEKDVIIRQNKVDELKHNPPRQLNEWMSMMTCNMTMINLLLATAGNTKSIVKGVLEAHFLPQTRTPAMLSLKILDSYLKSSVGSDSVRVTILSATSLLPSGTRESHFFAVVGSGAQAFIFDTYVDGSQRYGMPYKKMMAFLAGKSTKDNRLEALREFIKKTEGPNGMTGTELNEHWQSVFNNINLSAETVSQQLVTASFTASTHVTQKSRLNQFFASQLANHSYDAPSKMQQEIKQFLTEHQLKSAVQEVTGVKRVEGDAIRAFATSSSSMFESRELRAQVDGVCAEIKELIA